MAARTDECSKTQMEKLNNQLSFLPEKLLGRLMHFQKQGVVFAMQHDGRCLIGDEMGLGKTLQALSIAYYYREEWPLLIVVPSSLRYPWIDEIERWFPEIDPANINLIQSGTDTMNIATAQITVVTYGLLRCPSSVVLQEALLNQHFSIIIADESHNLKNRRSATSKYLVPLLQSADRRLLLTGTPALARPEEIDAVLPGQFGSWSGFAKRYCNARWQHFGRQARRWVTDGASNLEELQSLLCSQLMIRRLKKDVLTQLPPKQRQRVLFPIKESVLKKDLDQSWQELESAMGRGVLGTILGGEMVQGTSSSFDVHRLVSIIYRKTAAVKIGPVKEYVKMLCDNHGLKFIVFAHHHVMLDGVSELLHDEQVPFIRIDGTTDQQDRPHLVHEFQADKKIRVAVLSIKAAGVGLTLTAAKLVVFAELDWTPGVLEQAEDRAHRIGQKETVHVHYLVAKGTMDDWVWSALARKVTYSLPVSHETILLSCDWMDPLSQELELSSSPLSLIRCDILDLCGAQSSTLSDLHCVCGLVNNEKTTVVTTTLNGKRQVLRMDDANQGQVACLANAEAWIPKAKSDTDPESLTSFFNTQQQLANKQRSIAEFFTPKGQKRKQQSAKNGGAGKRLRESTNDTNTLTGSPLVYLIDSDDEGSNDFKSHKSPSRSKAVSHMFMQQSTPFSSKLNATPPSHDVVNSGTTTSTLPKWSCSVCTFLNHDALPMCEMCSTSKPKVRMAKKPDQNKTEIVDTTHVVASTAGQRLKGDGSDNMCCNEKEGIDTLCTNSQVHEISDDEDDLPDHFTTLAGPNGNAHSKQNQPDLAKEDRNLSHVSSQRHRTHEISDDDDLPDLVTTSNYQAGSGVLAGGGGQGQFNVVLGDSDSHSSSELLFDDFDEATDKDENDGRKATDESHVDVDVPQSPSPPPESRTEDHGKEVGLLFPESEDTGRGSWTCPRCESENTAADTVCDVCLGDRPSTPPVAETPGAGPAAAEGRTVDLDQVPVYERFQYCCSRNTSRIYLYDEVGASLDVNFIPLDVEMEIFAALPDLLLHPHNMRLVKRFLREWSSLAPTKRRFVVKSGQIFSNPLMHYEELKRGRVATKQRFTSKADVAAAAVSKAELINGSVRALTRPRMVRTSTPSRAPRTPHADSSKRKSSQIGETMPMGRRDAIPMEQQETTPTGKRNATPLERRDTARARGVQEESRHARDNVGSVKGMSSLPDTVEEIERMPGMVQALASDGTPLCVTCQKPYSNSLVSEATVRQNPWATRFCSQNCAEQFWTRRHGDYAKQCVFEVEHGVCQICNFNAHKFFERIKVTRDVVRRAELIQDSKYSVLSSDTKQQMARQPKKGQFWQADHIQAVSEGGGECDVDNLRTLCTPCHRDVTAEQAKRRVTERRQRKAAQCRDITAFFKPL